MPAYMVFIREKTLDQSELEAYWAEIRATMEGRPIKVLAAFGRHVTLEGPGGSVAPAGEDGCDPRPLRNSEYSATSQ